jgi:hypothetical protein
MGTNKIIPMHDMAFGSKTQDAIDINETPLDQIKKDQKTFNKKMKNEDKKAKKEAGEKELKFSDDEDTPEESVEHM